MEGGKNIQRNELVDSAELEFRRISSPMPTETNPSRVVKILSLNLLVVSLLQMCTVIGTTILLSILIIQNKAFKDPQITSSIAIIIIAGFNMYHIVKGVTLMKIYFLCYYIIGVFLISTFCVIDIIHDRATNHTICLTRLGLLAAFTPPNLILSYMVSKYFKRTGRSIFGASEAIQTMYSELRYFLSLLTLDLQISMIFVALRLHHGIKLSVFTLFVLLVGMPLCAVWNILGYISVKWEVKCLVWLFSLIGFMLPIYVIVDIIHFYTIMSSTFYPLIFYDVMVTGATFVIIRFILLMELKVVYKNFGYGLQDKEFAGLVSGEQTSLLAPPASTGPLLRSS